MNSFFVGLQFLSRIKIVNQTEWTAESFGKSVKFFPLIGAIIGLVLAGLAFILCYFLPKYGIIIPEHLRSLLLIIMWIIITGALHCDGFMDTMDGLFSGRNRDRMLEIMKDSRVGANGVTAFIILILLKWSILLDMSPERLYMALYAAPLIARMGMVMGITLFPYARPEGIGKAFAQYANKQTYSIALMFTIVLLYICTNQVYIIAALSLLIAGCFCQYVKNRLGGLTGDVYGAVTEITEMIVIGLFLI